MQRVHVSRHDIKGNSRMELRDPIDGSRDESRRQKWCAPDPHFPRRGVGKRLYAFKSLTEPVKDGHAPFEQRATVGSRLDPSPVPIEQANSDGVLQFGD